MEYYDRAFKGAINAKYTQEEALANELAAEFYFSCDRNSTAEVYLLQSYYSYIRWGAKAKAKDLETRYAEFFSKVLQREQREIDITQISTLSKTTGSIAAIDLATVARALQAISSETNSDRLLSRLMHIAVQAAGASKGLLFLMDGGRLQLVAEGSVDAATRLVSPVAIVTLSNLPISLIRYVERTRKTVVLNHAATEGIFTNDSYIRNTQRKSIFCYPLLHQEKFAGVLYLENNLTTGSFTRTNLEVLQLLASQVSVSLFYVA